MICRIAIIIEITQHVNTVDYSIDVLTFIFAATALSPKVGGVLMILRFRIYSSSKWGIVNLTVSTSLLWAEL